MARINNESLIKSNDPFDLIKNYLLVGFFFEGRLGGSLDALRHFVGLGSDDSDNSDDCDDSDDSDDCDDADDDSASDDSASDDSASDDSASDDSDDCDDSDDSSFFRCFL